MGDHHDPTLESARQGDPGIDDHFPEVLPAVETEERYDRFLVHRRDTRGTSRTGAGPGSRANGKLQFGLAPDSDTRKMSCACGSGVQHKVHFGL
jgi:hypothetical protein